MRLAPDFRWIATDSVWLYAVMVEIETPDKRWFIRDGKRKGQLHGDLVHAKSQLDHWKAWFAQPENQTAFLKQYQVPDPLVYRDFVQQDTKVMTFSRLAPQRPGFSTEAVQPPVRVNVTWVTPLGEEVASTS